MIKKGMGIVLFNIHRNVTVYYGGDKGKRGWKSEGSIAGANPEDQDAVDHCQNNKMLRQRLLRHCTATSVLCNYCPNCCVEIKKDDDDDEVELDVLGCRLTYQGQG